MTTSPSLLARLFGAFHDWYGLPPWHPSRRLREIRAALLEDHRLLGENAIACEILERYLAMSAADHYLRSHESPVQFRRRLGLDPEVVRHSRPAELLGADDDLP